MNKVLKYLIEAGKIDLIDKIHELGFSIEIRAMKDNIIELKFNYCYLKDKIYEKLKRTVEQEGVRVAGIKAKYNDESIYVIITTPNEEEGV